jgi:hypothetical protein
MRRAAWPLLLAAPLLAIQLYSDEPAKWSIQSHYGAPLVPLFAAAGVMALALLPAKGDLRTIAAAAWVSLVMMHDARALPSPLGPGSAEGGTFSQSPRFAALRKAIAAVPPQASISAQEDVVPHVASRADVHVFPDGEASDEYILLDREGAALRSGGTKAVDAAMDRLRTSSTFTVRVDEAGVLLLERVKTR